MGSQRATDVFGGLLRGHRRREPRHSQCLPFIWPTDVFKHHGARQNRRHGIRDILSGDVWRGAVNRLEYRNLSGMNIPGGRHAHSAGKLRAQIADDVAEQVAGDDDLELRGIADNFHR